MESSLRSQAQIVNTRKINKKKRMKLPTLSAHSPHLYTQNVTRNYKF